MSKRSFHLIIASIVGLMFVFGDAFFLWAQETGSEEFTLEEITVTAQKREENQQKVAIPMDVIMGEKLTEAGKTNVDDILSGLSNVLITKSALGMTVSARGLTHNDMDMADMNPTAPLVAINIDGAFNMSMRAGTNLFDIERVEVLYGPQSTMYASNSPGGIVNVVTAAPKTDKYSVNASVEVGSYSLNNFNFAGNAPIVKDALAMRLAAQAYKRDGFLSGEVGDNTKSARLKTLWQASDRFSATVTLNYAKRINGGKMGGQVRPFDYQDGHWYDGSYRAGYTIDGKVTDPWTPAPSSSGGGGAAPASFRGVGGNLVASQGPPPGPPSGPNQADQVTKGITAEINLDAGIGNLSVVPNYSKTTSDDQGEVTSGGVTGIAYTNMRDTQKGFEARMTSAEDFYFEWILGVNYYKDNNARYTTYSDPSWTNSYTMIYQKSKAVFGNITYPFTDKFRGTAGYRTNWDSPGSEMGRGTGEPMFSGQDYSNSDYKVGIEYDLAGNSMLYTNYATSYRTNAFAMPQEDKSIKPEELKAYTVGVKNRFLENKLQVNVAAYYYDYRNKSAPLTEIGRQGQDQEIWEDRLVDRYGNPVDYDGGGIEHKLISGVQDEWVQQDGDFRSIGMDVSADWIITSKDRLNLGISYLDAVWKKMLFDFYYKYLNDDGTIGKLWPQDGVDYGGYTNLYSPKWTITSSYEHVFQLGDLGMLVPHVDVQYKSDFVLGFDEVCEMLTYQEPYYLVNGSFTFTHSSGKWTFNAYVKNATNYAAKNFWNSQRNTMGVSDPRTFGGVFSVKF